jgi:hypothetical protein
MDGVLWSEGRALRGAAAWPASPSGRRSLVLTRPYRPGRVLDSVADAVQLV